MSSSPAVHDRVYNTNDSDLLRKFCESVYSPPNHVTEYHSTNFLCTCGARPHSPLTLYTSEVFERDVGHHIQCRIIAAFQRSPSPSVLGELTLTWFPELERIAVIPRVYLLRKFAPQLRFKPDDLRHPLDLYNGNWKRCFSALRRSDGTLYIKLLVPRGKEQALFLAEQPPTRRMTAWEMLCP